MDFRDFVFATERDFREMEQMMNDHMCHVFRCKMPAGCTPGDNVRIGLEKNPEGICFLYVDKGLTMQDAPADFRRFLESGTARFGNMEGLKTFLRSLTGLYGRSASGTPGSAGPQAPGKRPEEPVYDKEKLKEILDENKEPVRIFPEQISVPLNSRVFGQEEAINALARLIAVNSLRKEKKLLTVVFLGPTATGKSETAKSLADVLTEITGDAYGYIEIAGSEFIGEHTVHRFFGAPPGYVGHGEPTVLDPVRSNPRHVIVINEIEKADTKLLTGLMETIDTGRVGMADNSQPIDLSSCILIFTSNIPIEMDVYREKTPFQKAEMCRNAFTKHCGRPEISGKIGNFLVFNPLTDEASADVVVKFIREECETFGLELERVDVALIKDFLKNRTAYGARGIRNLVFLALSDRLLEESRMRDLSGRRVSLKGTISDIELTIT